LPRSDVASLSAQGYLTKGRRLAREPAYLTFTAVVAGVSSINRGVGQVHNPPVIALPKAPFARRNPAGATPVQWSPV